MMPGIGAVEIRVNHYALLRQLVGALGLPKDVGMSDLKQLLSDATSTPCLPPRYASGVQ